MENITPKYQEQLNALAKVLVTPERYTQESDVLRRYMLRFVELVQ